MKTYLIVFAALCTIQAQTHPPQSAHLTAANVRPSVDVSGAQYRALPRIVLGSEWETRIVLLNPGSTAVAFQQSFYDPHGTPVTVAIHSDSLLTDLSAASIQGVLTSGSSVTLDLSAPGGVVQDAWSLLSYSQGMLDGYAILRRRAAGGAFSFETTLPFSRTQDVSTYMPFDNAQDFRSQLTVVNPASDTSVQVRITCLNPQGGIVLIDSLSLAARQQMTLVLPDTYPDLANRTGTILIEADTDRLSIGGMRQNTNYGVISALPAVNYVPGVQ